MKGGRWIPEALEGSPFRFTLWVDDVDAVLRTFGQSVDVSQEPTDQPAFGQRTAVIRDPDGNLWEFSATISENRDT